MIKYCTRCKKRIAVVFVQKLDGQGKAETEAFCLKCAKELGINTDQINEMMSKMGIDEEQFEQLSDFSAFDLDGFGAPDAENDNDEDEDFEESESRAPSINFGAIFGGNKNKEEKNDAEKDDDDKKDKKKKKDKKHKYLDSFCINLNERAEQGKLDKVIGRERELDRMLQILTRRQKNNPCLIGEPGVGKTAVAEALAMRIVRGDVPHKLKKCRVYLLDMTLMVAGTQFRGQFENRMKGLIDEVKNDGHIILVIDEIHSIVSAGDAEGGMNAANILKPALSRSEIQVIGATTLAEYRKYIEKDAALERRFQPIVINEPSIADSIKILKGIKDTYEKYHGLIIPDETVEKTVIYSERYITDRFLPDKAIDLLDEAASFVALRDVNINRAAELAEELEQVKAEREELENEPVNPTDDGGELDRYQKLADLKVREINLADDFSELMALCNSVTVTPEHLAKVIEIWTGIPAGNISENEFVRIDKLAERLKERIVGQDEAVEKVAKAIKRSRAGISAKRKPVSFIFAGPTGIGKTELVKTLASDLFDSPEALIRLDMSEFMEKHAVSRIIGAPPGYVGYDEAGQLTEKIRRRPYSVILFDEIEKAHPDVMNVLLQILDDGACTDAHGKKVSFENTVIVMTTNAGSSTGMNSAGFSGKEGNISSDRIMNALYSFLRPEFINRVDEIVVFNQLTKQNFREIAKIMLSDLQKAVAEKSISLEYDEDVLDFVAEKSFSLKYGARNLRRFIQTEIEDRAAELIISNYNRRITKLRVRISGDTLEVCENL
ncbi:MAG: ATP-dependent Clp protease ATP-binding subunit [Clostridia bacterium]|nr:ATP-dependent Clp protease ATP-binding subunit [Clostridia bacterium]